MIVKQFLDTEGARHLAERVQNIVRNKTYTFSSITDKPTTLEGYGITDAAKKTDLRNYVTEENLGEDFVRKTELGAYAKSTDLNGYARTSDLTEFVTAADVQAMIATPKATSAATINEIISEGTTDKIIIEEDITLDTPLAIPAGEEIVLNLQDATITTAANKKIEVSGKLVLEGNGTIQASASGGTGRPIIVTEGGELVINGCNVINTYDCAIDATNGGTVTLNDGSIQAQEFGILVTKANSTININGGVVKTVDNACIGGNGTLNATNDSGGTIINMTGGRLEGHITSNGYVACGIYLPNHGICNVSGGEIVAIGGCGICLRAGTLNITGGFISGSGDPSLLGKVGDSRVVVGPNGIVFDQSAHYPGITVDAPDNGIHLNVYSGTITGKNAAIQVLKDDDFEADINVNGGLLMPPYEG